MMSKAEVDNEFKSAAQKSTDEFSATGVRCQKSYYWTQLILYFFRSRTDGYRNRHEYRIHEVLYQTQNAK